MSSSAEHTWRSISIRLSSSTADPTGIKFSRCSFLFVANSFRFSYLSEALLPHTHRFIPFPRFFKSLSLSSVLNVEHLDQNAEYFLVPLWFTFEVTNPVLSYVCKITEIIKNIVKSLRSFEIIEIYFTLFLNLTLSIFRTTKAVHFSKWVHYSIITVC